MKNRDKILQTCTYDMLVNMANNTGVCPLQAYQERLRYFAATSTFTTAARNVFRNG